MKIKTIHKTTIVGKCPHGCVDVYEAEFHVYNLVLIIEQIQSTIDVAVAEPIYQEQLAQDLANNLKCQVVLRGMHGRFDTTCWAEPEGI